MVSRGMVSRGMVDPGMVDPGMAVPGMAVPGMAVPGIDLDIPLVGPWQYHSTQLGSTPPHPPWVHPSPPTLYCTLTPPCCSPVLNA